MQAQQFHEAQRQTLYLFMYRILGALLRLSALYLFLKAHGTIDAALLEAFSKASRVQAVMHIISECLFTLINLTLLIEVCKLLIWDTFAEFRSPKP